MRDGEARDLRPEVAGLRMLHALGGVRGHAGLVDRAADLAELLGDTCEIEPRPGKHRIVGDDLLELVARILGGSLIEQRVGEAPAGAGCGGVALELRAQLLLADDR